MDSTEGIFASHSHFFTSPHVIVSKWGCSTTGKAYVGWNQSPPKFHSICVNRVWTPVFTSTLEAWSLSLVSCVCCNNLSKYVPLSS